MSSLSCRLDDQRRFVPFKEHRVVNDDLSLENADRLIHTKLLQVKRSRRSRCFLFEMTPDTI